LQGERDLSTPSFYRALPRARRARPGAPRVRPAALPRARSLRAARGMHGRRTNTASGGQAARGGACSLGPRIVHGGEGATPRQQLEPDELGQGGQPLLERCRRLCARGLWLQREPCRKPRHALGGHAVAELNLKRVPDHRGESPAARARRFLPALALARLDAKVDVLAPSRHATDCGHANLTMLARLTLALARSRAVLLAACRTIQRATPVPANHPKSCRGLSTTSPEASDSW
jgi:hypothetical protein